MNRLESLKRDLATNRVALLTTLSEYQAKRLREAIASQERAIAHLERKDNGN